MRPERFEIAFPDEALDDLRERLAGARWPDTPTASSWDEGTSVPYMRELAAAWQADGWRAHEAAMNAHEHCRIELDGQRIHYLHVRRSGELPLLLLHGWPSTHWDFAALIPQLDGLELVAPDLPGYGLSSPLMRTGIGFLETAELMHELMTEVLGHARYAVYGFDWGALIAEQLAHTHHEAVLALHTSMPFPLDFAPPAQELWTAEEQPFADLTARWWQEGSAYFQLQATRPQTLAFLADSPVALAAWIVEKLHAWSDHDGNVEDAFPREQILATLSLYWLTGTFGSAARFYAESLRRPWQAVHDGMPVVRVPTAVAAFPKENSQVPRRWVEQYFDLHRYTRMPKGGHFAPVEQPEALAGELTSFLSGL
jgi:pimeloyl-ACP methyl ester carboxylesterase